MIKCLIFIALLLQLITICTSLKSDLTQHGLTLKNLECNLGIEKSSLECRCTHETFPSNQNLTEEFLFSLKNLKVYGSCDLDVTYINSKCPGLHSISIHDNYIHQFSSKEFIGFPELKFLNLSRNTISTFTEHSFSKLQVLDISYNHISSFIIKSQGSFPALKQLHLQNNNLQKLNVEPALDLAYLDISNNPLRYIIKRPGLFFNNGLTDLYMENVTAVKTLANGAYMSLPAVLNHVSLQKNKLMKIPTCYTLLKGLRLKTLDLSYNLISTVTSSGNFTCLNSLKSMDLSNNKIVEIDLDFSSIFVNLNLLKLQNNYLQRLPLEVAKHFTGTKVLNFKNNPVTCDCTTKPLWNYVRLKSVPSFPIECKNVSTNTLVRLETLTENQLKCSPPVEIAANSSVAYEWANGYLSCDFYGVPQPLVHWVTPQNQTISFRSLALDGNDDFSLSPFGDVLTIKNMKISKTGYYRCIAENVAGVANQTVTIGVIPSSRSTIIVVAVACLSFIVAIIINFVNLTVYICDHFKKQKHKRLMRAVALEEEAAAKEKEEQKYDKTCEILLKGMPKTTLKSSLSLGCISQQEKIDDSTCQQMLLDTMVKGAHTVKKTISDARNSDFSANVIGYASSLRDRMHIEMPTTSFQMPTIPTMQNINSNIERIGTSVLTKSQNIATSVGSVLTLKRWMQQQQNQQQQQQNQQQQNQQQQQKSASEDEQDEDKSSNDSMGEGIKQEEVKVECHFNNDDCGSSNTSAEQNVQLIHHDDSTDDV